MNRDVGTLLRTLVALALFAFVTTQTLGSLRASGAWNHPGQVRVPAADDPIASIERLIAAPQPPLSGDIRDPFILGGAASPVAHAEKPVVHAPRVPPPPPKPVLTAIVWDADPRAIVRWKSRDWTIRAGGLFDEFQVTSITRDQVVLARGPETVVLQRKPQGD